ncbi:MAG: hypothetical protein HOW73_20475 [Polyangiaceae bacterium]|nr:hypothetical protein [Polyangiaceae bacterium]
MIRIEGAKELVVLGPLPFASDPTGVDWTRYVDAPEPGSLWVTTTDADPLFMRYVGPEPADNGDVYPVALVAGTAADSFPFWVVLQDIWREHWRPATRAEQEALREACPL